MIYCDIKNWVNYFCVIIEQIITRTNGISILFVIDPPRAIGETMYKIQLLRLIEEMLERCRGYYLLTTHRLLFTRDVAPQMLFAFPD